MKRIILTTTTCDNKYLDVMKVYLHTMKVNGKCDTLIRADLINGNEEIYSRLHRLYDNLHIIHLDMEKGVDWLDHSYMIKLMWARIPRMWETLSQGWDQVMTMDSDTIVRSPIGGIWEGAEPDTIKIWDRGPKKQPFTRVQAGVHIFGNSPNIREYYQAFMKDLGPEWEFRKGQAAIYTVYLEYKDKIRLVQMPRKYNDNKFDDGSVVWHCKHGHFDDPKYQKEYQHYLAQANKIYEA